MIDATVVRDRLAGISPGELARLLDFRALRRRGSGVRGPCPIHGGDADAFAVFPGESGLRWTCHTHCGSGDALALIAAAQRLDVHRDFGRVLEAAANLLGIDGHCEPFTTVASLSVADLDRHERGRLEAESIAQERAEVLDTFTALCELGSKALNYLRHDRKCWNLELQFRPAFDMGIGYYWPGTVERVTERVGEAPARRVLGVGPDKCLQRAELDFCRHPLILPVFGHGGVVAVQGRSIDPRCDKRHRYTSRGNASRGLFGGRDLDENDSLVVLAEGAIDALTLRVASQELAGDWGPFVAVGRPGVGGGLSERQADMLTGRRVLIAYDGDRAGSDGASKAATRLQNAGVSSVEILSVPTGADLNDLARGVAA